MARSNEEAFSRFVGRTLAWTCDAHYVTTRVTSRVHPLFGSDEDPRRGGDPHFEVEIDLLLFQIKGFEGDVPIAHTCRKGVQQKKTPPQEPGLRMVRMYVSGGVRFIKD